jgi:carbon-monoxide dehydrogenase large subunit
LKECRIDSSAFPRRSSHTGIRKSGRGIYRGIGVAAYTHMCGMAPSRRLAMSGFDRGGWESARVAIDSTRQC